MRYLWAIVVSVLLASSALATPSVTSITGNTTANLSTVTISGLNFGTKSPAAPIIWADFESSINPTSLGQHSTAWDENTFFTRNASAGYNGTGGAVGTGDTVTPQSYTLRIDKSYWTELSGVIYIFRRGKMNFAITSGDNGQNSKLWRVFSIGSPAYPNMYFAANNGRFNVEDQSVPDTGFWSNFDAWAVANTWKTEEILCKTNSVVDVKDGALQYKVNGQEMASGAIMPRYSARPNKMVQNYAVHFVFSNTFSWTGGWSDSNTVYADDVYVDDTFARVICSNNANLDLASKVSIAVPSSWGSTSINALLELPTNDFPPSSTAYLHVCDSSNVCSPGKSFTVGGSAPANPTPTIVSVNKVFVSTTSGTTIVATCTNLTSTLTGVTLGGTACTSVVRDSATQFTCVLPAKAAGTYNLVVTCSDAQTGTLTNAITTRNKPIIVALSTGTVTNLGGTTVTFSATDLVTGFTISIGGTSATSPTFIDSTHGSFVTPVKANGSYTITITGPSPDSQTSTFDSLTFADIVLPQVQLPWRKL